MEDKTVLGLTIVDKLIFIVFATIIGSVAGYFIKILAGWAAKIPFIPFSPLWEWMSEWHGSWVPIAGVIIGVIAGIIFSVYAFGETLHITVKDRAITFRFKKDEQTIPSADIGTVYMEKKILVVLDPVGRELYRGKPEAKRYKVIDAFRYHDYPWEEQDPYLKDYQMWKPEHPDFPSHVNATLADREKALKDEKEEEAERLRKQLVEVGAVIHDDKNKQYVRFVGV